MNSEVKPDEHKSAYTDSAKRISAVPGESAMLASIREAREKCGSGVKMLPVLRHEGKLWFLDERLKQLRNVRNPHDYIDLNDFEVEYFKSKVV